MGLAQDWQIGEKLEIVLGVHCQGQNANQVIKFDDRLFGEEGVWEQGLFDQRLQGWGKRIHLGLIIRIDHIHIFDGLCHNWGLDNGLKVVL